MTTISIFENLSQIDVTKFTEKKPTGRKKQNSQGVWEDSYLTYLSWMNAWAIVKQKYPTADYKIERFENKPYMFDEKLGYMVFTSVIIDGESKDCWLPVMDGNNNAMKHERYSYFVNDYKTKTKVEKFVEAATMFDINTTIMRCLAKNLAMHGLGAYIYAGDDLPFTWGDNSTEIVKEDNPKQEPIKQEPIKQEPIKQEPIKQEPIDRQNLQAEIISLWDACYKQAVETDSGSACKIDGYISNKFAACEDKTLIAMRNWLLKVKGE